MRSVPQDIKQKLLKRFYGISTDNLPKIQVIAKQASINTLITEIIHDDIFTNFGDVAIRQLQGEVQPSLVYAICIDDGTGNVYSRKMPTFAEQEWVYLWSVGTVKDVAIEFDGIWQINPRQRYYELMTEQTPYVFFTDASDNLFVQKWSDATTRIALATGASNISACRGWQSTLDTGVDQGLIIGYLRDGRVFYRARCQQNNGEYIWESENEITELGSGNSTLSVFRTNDFRIGFITEKDGVMNFVLSERTYAGQAMPPEFAAVWPQDVKVWINDLQHFYPKNSEHGLVVPDKPYLACYGKDEPDLAIVEHERIGLRELVITFNRMVGGVFGAFENYFTTTPVRTVEACYWQNGNQLRIILDQDLGQSVDYFISVSECHEAWQIIGGHRIPIEASEFVLEGLPIQTILNETVVVTPIAGIALNSMMEHSAYLNECVTVSAESIVTLPPVGVLPI